MSDTVARKEERSREISNHATIALCGHSGSVQFMELYKAVCERFDLTQEEFRDVLSDGSRFVIVRKHWERTDDWETQRIVAKTSLRLCKNYADKTCSLLSCNELHLCKNFIYGSCRYGDDDRGPCEFSHDLHSNHNDPILRKCALHKLPEEELSVLLLQNDPALLPTVCTHYNMGVGPFGFCGFGMECDRVHLCGDFVQGRSCKRKCTRLHVMTPTGRRNMWERGFRVDLRFYCQLTFIYQNIYEITKTSEVDHPKEHGGEKFSRPGKRPREDEQTPEICLYFLYKTCRYKDACFRVHWKRSYRWEVFERGRWRDLRYMEVIERHYCDPRNTHSFGSETIDFLTMTVGSDPVRRLSTCSSVTKLPMMSSSLSHLTTEWVWYYKGDNKNWIEYGQPEEDTKLMTTVSSQQLEEMYLADPTAEVTVMKGHRYYFLSFQDMYQRNPKHNTKRSVRRRPRNSLF